MSTRFTKTMAIDWLGHHALAIRILVEALAPVAGVSTATLTQHVFRQAKDQFAKLSNDELLAIVSRQLAAGTCDVAACKADEEEISLPF